MSRVVLETERLYLREIEPEDLDFFAEMLGDSETMAFWPRPQSRSEAKDWIERHRQRYADHGYGYWLVVRRADRAPIGQAGLLHQEVEGESMTGLGYMIHYPYWGQGYAIEAARACLDHAFSSLRLGSIRVLIRPENLRSVHLAQKLAATFVKRTEYAGFVHDVYEVTPMPLGKI